MGRKRKSRKELLVKLVFIDQRDFRDVGCGEHLVELNGIAVDDELPESSGGLQCGPRRGQ